MFINRALLFPSFKPPCMPVTIVCGPPGSGKSHYVSQVAMPDDLVIDLDVIASQLSGFPVHDPANQSFFADALKERNRILGGLCEEGYDHVWFVMAGRLASDRAFWANMLRGKVLIINTPLKVCIERIRSDPTRATNLKLHIELAAKWWQEQHKR